MIKKTTTYAQSFAYGDDEKFPYLKTWEDSEDCQFFPCSSALYECWQPDLIENDEFNLIILLHGSPVRVIGSHFDFIEK